MGVIGNINFIWQESTDKCMNKVWKKIWLKIFKNSQREEPIAVSLYRYVDQIVDVIDTARLDKTRERVQRKAEKRKQYRKYDDQYLDFGFTYVGKGNVELPQCVVCDKVLAAESMLPNKLKRHLETSRSNLLGKPRDFFARKLQELKHQPTSLISSASIPSKALLASYKVADRIAECKKPHTIAEDLILPAAIDMILVMIGDRRIHDIAKDINKQIVEKHFGLFAIQLDGATDSNNDTQLICYVRYMEEANVCEDLLFCKEMTTGKASDLFAIINSYTEENNIQWENCVSVCTDGARAQSGRYGGLQALIKTKAPNGKWTHCVIHREALATKNISPELNLVIDIIIKV
ncbi:SCAN domain-containing protein 3-like, partial [Centruroides vittatus]|uniref:SCAN domain-containing protein 3-like n=1 Tax=Centruroides vittatus TaxID=120091 RepID=UPI00350EC6A2